MDTPKPEVAEVVKGRKCISCGRHKSSGLYKGRCGLCRAVTRDHNARVVDAEGEESE